MEEKENTLGGLRTQHASLWQELVMLHLEPKCEAVEEREKMGVWHPSLCFYIQIIYCTNLTTLVQYICVYNQRFQIHMHLNAILLVIVQSGSGLMKTG